MGQRANFIVIENGERTIYYDHWAANRLDDELFWGPDEALHFFRQRDPVGNDGWLDEVWCEGAAIVDLDRKKLLFFGGEDVHYDARLRSAYLDLLRRQWPGWDVRWAPEGLMTIVDELGLPRENFARKREATDGVFAINRAHPDWSDVLLTIQPLQGPILLSAVIGDEEGLLGGIAPIDKLIEGRFFGLFGRLPLMPTLRWEGGDFPKGGVHIDRKRQRVTTWWSPTTGDVRRAAERAWSGWTLDWRFDDYEWHLALCGKVLALPPFDEREAQQQILERLEQTLVDAPPRNPARALDLGEGTQINAWTDHSRGNEHSLEKRAVIDRLRRSAASQAAI